MRILVLSDSHGHIERMSHTAKQVNPDAIIHLGDRISDARKLHILVPSATVYMVKGNCDLDATGEKDKILLLDGKKIYMTHGHLYNVKMGLTTFIYRAKETGADIALYGHTHRAMMKRVDGIWIMNPGQMERHDKNLKATYGIISILDGKIDMELKNLDADV